MLFHIDGVLAPVVTPADVLPTGKGQIIKVAGQGFPLKNTPRIPAQIKGVGRLGDQGNGCLLAGGLENLPALVAEGQHTGVGRRRHAFFPGDAQTGTEYAEQELRRIIIARTQTYIMDKAASFGVTVDVEVVLNEYTPQSVILKGSVSPGAKAQLTAWITENLGIPKEAQQWN